MRVQIEITVSCAGRSRVVRGETEDPWRLAGLLNELHDFLQRNGFRTESSNRLIKRTVEIATEIINCGGEFVSTYSRGHDSVVVEVAKNVFPIGEGDYDIDDDNEYIEFIADFKSLVLLCI